MGSSLRKVSAQRGENKITIKKNRAAVFLHLFI
jgi:hypothetical protein